MDETWFKQNLCFFLPTAVFPEPEDNYKLHLGRCQLLTVDELDMTGSCRPLASPHTAWAPPFWSTLHITDSDARK